MSTVHGVIHTYIVCVYEFRRGFCTSVLSFYKVRILIHIPYIKVMSFVLFAQAPDEGN